MNEDKTQKHLVHTTKEAVLSRIEEEGITPRPRWHFLVREWTVWSLGGISVAVGAGAIAALIFEIRHAGWDLYAATHPSFLAFLIEMLPYLWVMLLVIFAASAYLFVRHTKCGYRYSYISLLVAPVLTSGLSGVALYAFGAGELIERHVGSAVPFHVSAMERERVLWSVPRDGRIAGMVYDIALPARDVLFVEGSDGREYRINVTAFRQEDLARMKKGDYMRILTVPTTTPDVLDGCVIFLRNDDVLVRFGARDLRHAKEPQAFDERNTFFARSTECQRMPPFVRLKPLTGIGYEAEGVRGDSE